MAQFVNLNEIVPTLHEEEMLTMLKKMEGGILHYNPGEKDITNGYGIYKFAHPDEPIWDYIDEIARNAGIMSSSDRWDKQTVKVVNNLIDPNVERLLSLVFYRKYFAPTRMEVYPANFVKCLVSIYTNGVKLYNKTLQNTLNKMIDAGRIPGNRLKVDGAVGNMTLAIVSEVTNRPELHEEFKHLFLDTCRESYKALADSNPAKYGKFLKGWYNRVESLRA